MNIEKREFIYIAVILIFIAITSFLAGVVYTNKTPEEKEKMEIAVRTVYGDERSPEPSLKNDNDNDKIISLWIIGILAGIIFLCFAFFSIWIIRKIEKSEIKMEAIKKEAEEKIKRHEIELKDKIEAIQEKANESGVGRPERNYEYNANKIEKIYDFCRRDGRNREVFKNTVTKTDFINAVASADFKNIFVKEGTVKTKLKYIICIVSYSIDTEANDWYKKAAESIGVTPSRCSGIYEYEDWRDEANGLK